MKTNEEIKILAESVILTKDTIPTSNIYGQLVGFQTGYKTAQQELFTLEDLKEAFDEGSSACSSCSDIEYGFNHSMYDSWKKDFLKQKLDEKST